MLYSTLHTSFNRSFRIVIKMLERMSPPERLLLLLRSRDSIVVLASRLTVLCANKNAIVRAAVIIHVS